jgi:aspartyl-tRNA(Asn)/glutamyl-tRNA(Gln) amidotransferase subunit C
MKISRSEVEKVANLSRLYFNEHEIDNFTNKFNDILLFIEQLNELDTSDVQPTFHAIDLTNVFREDVAIQSDAIQDVVKVAPEVQNQAFVVPKII